MGQWQLRRRARVLAVSLALQRRRLATEAANGLHRRPWNPRRLADVRRGWYSIHLAGTPRPRRQPRHEGALTLHQPSGWRWRPEVAALAHPTLLMLRSRNLHDHRLRLNGTNLPCRSPWHQLGTWHARRCCHRGWRAATVGEQRRGACRERHGGTSIHLHGWRHIAWCCPEWLDADLHVRLQPWLAATRTSATEEAWTPRERAPGCGRH